MALDTSNMVRVDLQELFNACEHQTIIHSRNHDKDLHNQEIVICKDDYELIWSWANDAAVLIADECTYITNTNQTGLDAISNPYTDVDPNPHDEKDIQNLLINQKQTGEYLSKEVMDTLQFNVEQMQGLTPLKYSVTQTQIRAALIEYILFKWYEVNKIPDMMAMKWQQFEYWVNKLKTNTL
ncbi:MAG TPA: hypothetical protein DCS64_08440, partial [Algoriphagus sp.]